MSTQQILLGSQTSTSSLTAKDATSVEHELKSHKRLSTPDTFTSNVNNQQNIVQYANELQKYILQDNIVRLSQKLSEISTINDVMIQSVLSCVFDEKTSYRSQTLLMTAMCNNNVAAFDVIINQPVECL